MDKMLKKFAIAASLALALGPVAGHAAGAGGHVEDIAFSFEGPFGKYDQNQLQRGLQIYTEVCAACHGMKFVPIRSLGDEGGPALPEDQVRAYAEQHFEVFDPELDDTRPAKPTDNFPANTSAGAPDLSLMAKARAGFHGPLGTGISQLVNGIGGPEYIASVLTGYTGETKEEAGTLFYENHAFSTGWIAMPPPLAGEDVEFADGHSNSLHHEAQDVAAFLMWAAEPKMMARKQSGLVGVIFLVILAALLYLTNKRIWAPIKGKKHHA
jgi:ubiquinol-cytochrome c reductase cytochrome c1 subunit